MDRFFVKKNFTGSYSITDEHTDTMLITADCFYELDEENERTQKNYEDLQQKHALLEKKYDDVNYRYENIVKQYNSDRREYEDAVNRRDENLKEISKLSYEVDSLKAELSEARDKIKYYQRIGINKANQNHGHSQNDGYGYYYISKSVKHHNNYIYYEAEMSTPFEWSLGADYVRSQVEQAIKTNVLQFFDEQVSDGDDKIEVAVEKEKETFFYNLRNDKDYYEKTIYDEHGWGRKILNMCACYIDYKAVKGEWHVIVSLQKEMTMYLDYLAGNKKRK